MDKFSAFGELLYIGFRYEKSRCKSRGLWKFGYKKRLTEHLEFLKSIINRLDVGEISDEDYHVFTNLKRLCENNKDLKRIYFNDSSIENKLKSNLILNETNNFNHQQTINNLMLELVEHLLLTLKSKPTDKAKAHMLLRALHNLPRFYFNQSDSLYGFQNQGISFDDATEYSISNMDEGFRHKFKGLIEV